MFRVGSGAGVSSHEGSSVGFDRGQGSSGSLRVRSVSLEGLSKIDARAEVVRTDSLRQIGLDVPSGMATLVPTAILPTFESAVAGLQQLDLSQPLQRPLTMTERGSLSNLQTLGVIDESLVNAVLQENRDLDFNRIPLMRPNAGMSTVPSRPHVAEAQFSSGVQSAFNSSPASRTELRSGYSRQETQGAAVGGGQPPLRPEAPERRNIWRRIRESDYYPQSLRSATWLASTATSAFWSAATTLRAHKSLANPGADKFYIATSVIETYPITYAFWRAYVLENRSVKQKAAQPNPIRGDEQV